MADDLNRFKQAVLTAVRAALKYGYAGEID